MEAWAPVRHSACLEGTSSSSLCGLFAFARAFALSFSSPFALAMTLKDVFLFAVLSDVLNSSDGLISPRLAPPVAIETLHRAESSSITSDDRETDDVKTYR